MCVFCGGCWPGLCMLKLDEGSGRAGETGRGQEECDEHQRPCVRVVMRGEGEIPLKKKIGYV